MSKFGYGTLSTRSGLLGIYHALKTLNINSNWHKLHKLHNAVRDVYLLHVTTVHNEYWNENEMNLL